MVLPLQIHYGGVSARMVRDTPERSHDLLLRILPFLPMRSHQVWQDRNILGTESLFHVSSTVLTGTTALCRGFEASVRFPSKGQDVARAQALVSGLPP